MSLNGGVIWPIFNHFYYIKFLCFSTTENPTFYPYFITFFKYNIEYNYYDDITSIISSYDYYYAVLSSYGM